MLLDMEQKLLDEGKMQGQRIRFFRTRNGCVRTQKRFYGIRERCSGTKSGEKMLLDKK